MQNNSKLKIEEAIQNKSESLNLSDCGLMHIPKEIAGLKYLKHLDLSYNEFEDLELSFLPQNLESLDISFNHLDTLPEGFIKLPRLLKLNFSNNQVSKLPDDYFKLKKLKTVIACNCNFVEFPKELLKLKTISEIDFHNNYFSELLFNDEEVNGISKMDFFRATSHFCKNLSPNIHAVNLKTKCWIGLIHGSVAKRPFATPIEFKGVFKRWSHTLLDYFGLYYKEVKLTADYDFATKGMTGIIGIHDPQIGYSIYDATSEFPVIIGTPGSHVISCGIPFDFLEFVDSQIADTHNHSNWSDGSKTIRELTMNAIRYGVKSVGISDHLETSKCPSLPQNKIPEYIAEIKAVQAEFEGMVELYAGVEINLNRKQTDLDNLNFSLLNQLDYVLWEYVNYNPNCVTFEELPLILDSLKIASGLAHTNILSIAERHYADKGGLDYILQIMQKHHIAWEVNVNQGYVFFKHFLEPTENQKEENEAFYEKLRQYNIHIVTGSDTHSIVYFNFKRLHKSALLVNSTISA